MRVDIKEGGDGHRCWNAEAIRAYADRVDAREAELAAANPDVEVIGGLVRCYGCEVQEYHYGTKCTAVLTRSLYAVRGETAPRPEDATAFPSEIPGLLGTEPGSAGLGSTNAPVEAPAATPETGSGGSSGSGSWVAQEPPDREPRRRGLFRR